MLLALKIVEVEKNQFHVRIRKTALDLPLMRSIPKHQIPMFYSDDQKCFKTWKHALDSYLFHCIMNVHVMNSDCFGIGS